MALYDENGKITIDEYAAQKDINRIRTARAALNDSLKTINSLINQASTENGQTSSAIVDKATEMKNQIVDMLNRLSETESFISKTVSHYQWVDQQVKNLINAGTTNIGADNHK